MSIASFSVRQRVLVNLVSAIGMIAGFFVLRGLPVDVFPNVSFAQAKVQTVWLGASEEDVEQFVTRKLEEELAEVQGVDRIVSHSQRDLSLIDVKFREDLAKSDYERYLQDLRAAVERVTDLPEGAEKPLVTEQTVNEIYPLIQVSVVPAADALPGASPRERETILRSVAKELRRRLQDVEDVLRVSDFPIRDRNYRLIADPEKLEAAHLGILDLRAAILAAHLDLPAGPSREGRSTEVVVRSKGEVDDADDLLAIEVPLGDGRSMALGDLARVEEDFERRTFITRFGGSESLGLGVFKRDGSDSITVRDRVLEAVEEFRGEKLPAGLRVETSIDTTKVIKSRIRVLETSLAFGSVLVFLVLSLFIGWRNSVLAILGLPFSMLVAFCFLTPFGITINAISLFSMVLVSGMLVDDAIIVIENIYRHIEMGKDRKTAIIDGTNEVAWPVVSASLTTIAAFLPMLLMDGVVGIFLSIIPKTVTVCLLASVIECFLVLPSHYVDIGPRHHAASAFDRRFGAFRDAVVRRVAQALRHPKRVLFAAFSLVALAVFGVSRIPVNLFPSDFQAFYVNLVLPAQASLEETNAACARIEQVIAEVDRDGDIETFTTSVGVTWTTDNQILIRPNVAQTLVSVSDAVLASGDSERVIAEVRRRIGAYLEGPGADLPIKRFEVDAFQDGPPIGKPVAVRVTGDDYDALDRVARRIAAELESLPGVHGVGRNLEPGPEEVRIVPRRDRLAEYGVAFADVALAARAAIDGLDCGKVHPPDTDDEIEIRLLLDRPEGLDSSLKAARATLRSSRGDLVRLDQVAATTRSQGFVSRYHYDGRRCVLVTAEVDSGVASSADVNGRLERRVRESGPLPAGVNLHFGGEFEETQRSFRSLGFASVVAILAIYAVLAAQFRGWRSPLIIIAAVPLGFLGVVTGLITLGHPFTVMTFIGLVGLAGISVNDAIVLLEFLESAWRRGVPPFEAALNAVRDRLRAVILTTATTVFGLLPMAFEWTGRSKIWSPFAATLSFGLSFACGLTIFVIPAIWLVTVGRKPPPIE